MPLRLNYKTTIELQVKLAPASAVNRRQLDTRITLVQDGSVLLESDGEGLYRPDEGSLP